MLERISTYIEQSSKSADLYNYVRTNQLLNHGKKSLSEAVLKILLCAKNTGQWGQRKLVFDNEETRYLHRFKSFIPLISPPHPSYELFLETVEIDDFDVDRMKEIITKDLEQTKKVLEHVLSMSAEETNTEMCHDRFTEV